MTFRKERAASFTLVGTLSIFAATSIPPVSFCFINLLIQPIFCAFLLHMADERKTPEPENADLTVMFKKRHVVRKGNKRKMKSDDDSSDESDPGTQAPRGVKRNKPNVPVTATSLTNTKASSSDPEAAFTKSTDFQVGKSYIDDATKQSHWFDDQSSRDHNALGRGLWETSGKALSMNKESAKMERQPKAKIFGPAKAAPANVRITTMFDYAPDVCKDVSPPPAIPTIPLY